MKKTTLLLIIVFVYIFGYSQSDSVIITTDTTNALDIAIDSVETDSLDFVFIEDDTTEYELNLDANVDSLINIYYVEKSLKNDSLNPISIQTELIPDFPDSIYRERLDKIPSVARLSYNTLVKRYIEVYTVKRRKQVEIMLGMADHYFPMFDEIFDYYDVPNEMKYMSIIESALNPNAYSRARAVGLWQFMYGTGRVYGLDINSLVDERRDPIKSTHAAAKFIKDLYGMYGDWLLALAAYNCGPGNVNKAIRRSRGKKNFWEIYYYLPRETRGHVPAFIAATYTMNYYQEHNLKKAQIEFPKIADTIIINDKLHLKQVSEILNIPLEVLRNLNPQYRYDIVPGHIKPYALRLPEQKVIPFIDLQDSILAYKDSIFFNEHIVTKPVFSYARPKAPGSDYIKLTYTVKSGDAVGLIADWYDIRSSDLRYWNNIRRNLIRSGQKLTIYKHKTVANKYRDIDKISYSEKQKRNGKTTSPKANSVSTVYEELKEGEYVLYTVKSGDTLWEIAKQHPGISDTDIMKWNNISDPGSIKPGQKLKIKSGS